MNTIKLNSWIKCPRDNMYKQVIAIDTEKDTIHIVDSNNSTNHTTIMGIDWANSYYDITDLKGACERALQLINSGVYRTNQFKFKDLTPLLQAGGTDLVWEYEIDTVFSYLFSNGQWKLSVMDNEKGEITLPLALTSESGHLMCCCYTTSL